MRFFKFLKRKKSGKIAKERLEILLITDRIGCNPSTTEAIKREVISAISKYIDIDKDNCIIEIQHTNAPCLLANIPIKELKV